MGFSRKNSIRGGKLFWMQCFRIISLVAKLLPLYSKVMRRFLAGRQTSQKGVELKEGWWKDLRPSPWRKVSDWLQALLTFASYCYRRGKNCDDHNPRGRIPPLLLWKVLTQGSHSNWIFAIQPRLLNGFSVQEKGGGEGAACGGSKGCLCAGGPEVLLLDLAFNRDSIMD